MFIELHASGHFSMNENILPDTREQAIQQCASQCSPLLVSHESLVQMLQRGMFLLWLRHSPERTAHSALKRRYSIQQIEGIQIL